MRAARSPDELARLALVPAARNLGIAAGFLPADLRAEATAALLACRVLDAYEDLSDRPLASGAVLTAVDYLNGDTDTPPPAGDRRPRQRSRRPGAGRAHPRRAGAAVGAALRGPQRVGQMLVDVGRVMARNLDSPAADRLRRGRARAGGALRMLTGRRMPAPRPIWASWPDASASPPSWPTTCATANWPCTARRPRGTDPGGDAARAGPGAGRLRPAGPARPITPNRGARTAMAYMTITTTAFLCAAVGSAHALPATAAAGRGRAGRRSPVHWTTMLERVRRSADGAIHRLLIAPPVAESLAAGSGAAAEVLGLGDPRRCRPRWAR